MQGRIENKIKTEKLIQRRIQDAPDFVKEFYYSLNTKTHMTKLRYIGNVLRFFNYKFGEDVENITVDSVSKITALDIEKYVNEINYIADGDGIKEMSGNSKAIILSSLSMFFDFMKANEYIKKSPFENKRIQRPKAKEKDVVFLTKDEVKRVEKTILDRPNTDSFKWRDLLLFRIPVINGLRVTALSEINIDDIDFVKHSIRVVEKGDIRKDVYVDDQTMQYIRYWFSERKNILSNAGVQSDALFISNANQRITVRSIERIITRTTSKVIPDKHITPHKLRSTCGVNLYQAKKDIYLVASVLGHKSTEPTRRYTKVFDEDKRDAINTMAEIYK